MHALHGFNYKLNEIWRISIGARQHQDNVLELTIRRKEDSRVSLYCRQLDCLLSRGIDTSTRFKTFIGACKTSDYRGNQRVYYRGNRKDELQSRLQLNSIELNYKKVTEVTGTTETETVSVRSSICVRAFDKDSIYYRGNIRLIGTEVLIRIN